MAFGSRLKRLLERNNKDISRFYRLLGADFEARWFSTLYLLGRRSPMTITGIADKLSFTHPAVNKIIAQMSRAGLVDSFQGRKDKRRRMVELTEKGRSMIVFLTPVWDDISDVMTGLIAESGHDFMEAINEIENRLDERSLYTRLKQRSKQRLLDEIVILDYRIALKKHFKELNYEWLKEYFKVEKHDEEILSDPYGIIVKSGGCVIFAKLGRQVVGTCALIRHRDGNHELSKLAVTREARGRFVGTKLVTAVIERARESEVETLYLETSPEDQRVISFFESLGFKKMENNPLPARYKRPRITMCLNL